MKTLYYYHPDFLLHETGVAHPECADRLRSISSALEVPEFSSLIRLLAPLGTAQQIRLVHPHYYVEAILSAIPEQGHHHLDQDTVLSHGSK